MLTFTCGAGQAMGRGAVGSPGGGGRGARTEFPKFGRGESNETIVWEDVSPAIASQDPNKYPLLSGPTTEN